ncbi:hypothetical protein Sme01_03180 [Sphaerisporangium melleum]|uniref:Uncharacterized protein n=1 Tax=Sphaerisporangium melleum TaxID=321316 RepID=A0A917QP75_9ACTN|nr:hypothetical protein [Sphaerisporangium melleum]GGK61474.1 hypothetical protein GCM10007964_00720 [Sphaerisporangium melleum]GII67842.1 hypothetical protein Sme01_03180 [Sphaerisporangium melleum]
MTTVWLGNRKAVEVTRKSDGSAERRPLKGKRCTTVSPPEGQPIGDTFTAITGAGGLWPYHSDAPAPAWVASTDPALAQLLASHYGCELRDPEA